MLSNVSSLLHGKEVNTRGHFPGNNYTQSGPQESVLTEGNLACFDTPMKPESTTDCAFSSAVPIVMVLGFHTYQVFNLACQYSVFLSLRLFTLRPFP